MLRPGSSVVLRMTNVGLWNAVSAMGCLFFSPSDAGTHVCLLDSAQHVPDSEVLGHFGWHHIPGRQQDAGSESCEEVRAFTSVGWRWQGAAVCQWALLWALGPCVWGWAAQPHSLPLDLSRAVRGCAQGAAPAQRIGHVACAKGSSWNSGRL